MVVGVLLAIAIANRKNGTVVENGILISKFLEIYALA
jgi:hypothetical protein